MSLINLNTIFKWRETAKIINNLQIYGLIPKNGELKCPVLYCNGFMKVTEDKNVSDGVRWYCWGNIRCPKARKRKCNKR